MARVAEYFLTSFDVFFLTLFLIDTKTKVENKKTIIKSVQQHQTKADP